jgi:hypothetical protein
MSYYSKHFHCFTPVAQNSRGASASTESTVVGLKQSGGVPTSPAVKLNICNHFWCLTKEL